MTWQVRPYEPTDEAGIVALWQVVFGKPMSLDTWRWKFMGRPSVAPNVWVATDADGNVIGHHGGIPLELKIGDAVMPAFAAVDEMTHPDFRRRGISTTLLRTAHEMWVAAGIGVSIGLPNETIGTWRSLATSAFELGRMRRSLRLDEVVTRPGALPRRLGSVAAPVARLGSRLASRSWPRRDGSVDARRIDLGSFNWAEMDKLWAAVSPSYENCAVRDASWWRWRFAECPQFRYNVVVAYAAGLPVGAAAFRLHDEGGARRGVLADVLGRPGDQPVFDALMRAAFEDLWQLRAGTVHALAPVGSPLARTLRGYGFRGQQQGFEFMHIPLTEAGRRLSRDPRTWHMSGAEFDVV